MFGYIKPAEGELLVKEWKLYRAVYCGMCRALGRGFGFISRFALNYDFVFLAVMRMCAAQTEPEIRKARCPFNPFRKEPMMLPNEELFYTAAAGVLLSYYKMCDDMHDERFWGKIRGFFGAALLAFPARRARKKEPELADAIRERLEALSALEKENCAVPDQAAECFAQLLAAAASDKLQGPGARVMQVVGYHTGRWIYLLDAYDDLERDAGTGAYNPFLAAEGSLAAAQSRKDAVDFTLTASLAETAAAAALLDTAKFGGIVDNILRLGMPAVQKGIISRSEPENSEKAENSE